MRALSRAFSCGLLILLVSTAALAHDARTALVVDTDVALDDLRAIALLAGDPGVDIEAVVLTDPRQGMEQAARDVRRVLDAAGRPDVPIAAGARDLGPDPGWPGSPVPAQGDAATLELAEAEEALDRVLRDSHHPLVWVALGPLTTLARWIEDDDFRRASLVSVHWSGGLPYDDRPGWNIERDRASARALLESGLPIRAVSLFERERLHYDEDLHGELKASNSPLARAIVTSHGGETNAKLIASAHLVLWDDAVALDLLEPELVAGGRKNESAAVVEKWHGDDARKALVQRLTAVGARSSLAPRPAIVLESFPRDPAAGWRKDVKPLVAEIIARHGEEEWTATWLTSELHRHLGIYSIVGAKMGIRAREILGASLDEVKVVSGAGLAPPVSCLNDGLQVSTGASLGRGTIRVVEGEPLVEARFSKGERSVTLSLKPEILARIRSDVGAAVKKHGGPSGPAYFSEIRALSLRYWLELDRHEIFVESGGE